MSTTDRPWDPFAPAARATPAPPRAAAEPDPDRELAPLPSGVDELRKAELVELADERGLDTSGTRPTLIARLRGTDKG